MVRLTLKSIALTSWCELLQRGLTFRQGKIVSQLVSTNYILQFINYEDIVSTKVIFEAYSSTIKVHDVPLKPLLVSLFKLIKEKVRDKPNLTVIVTHSISVVNAFLDIYRSSAMEGSSNWLVPSLISLLNMLDAAGVEADAQCDLTGVEEDDVGNSISNEERFQYGALRQTQNQQKVLNTIRQHIGKFRGDEFRQAGYIVLMSESIQLCMRLGNIQMASAFLKTVESSHLDVSKIPRAPLVTFKYFLGKLYMQQEKFQKADEALTWSFANCSENNKELKKHILECLAAVRLRNGKIPSNALLKKYSLNHYADVVQAIKTGDIRCFESTLSSKTDLFVEEGTLLCVEKLKFIVYRTLFKRILEWAKKELYDGKIINVVPLGVFTAGFGWQIDDKFVPFDNEEMACITANLIKLRYVKGYIAWEYGKIVLSKQTPLPRLKQVQIS
ncbi:PCI domain-containing protein 2-like isoform X2 [Hylaeus volcanicus]|uniref:PCI domain-containing protein 2-like isoform X2 n=1 Tax=Hylaeus volcanicus TaxID=313075 RepID=UPI0023B830DE|nr:PCI domain-containing protein 2-like isoform X2 [Hylaeus volcanicus]